MRTSLCLLIFFVGSSVYAAKPSAVPPPAVPIPPPVSAPAPVTAPTAAATEPQAVAGPFPESPNAPPLAAFWHAEPGTPPSDGGAGISELHQYIESLMKRAEGKVKPSQLAAFRKWWADHKWDLLGASEVASLRVPDALNLAYAQYQTEQQLRDQKSRLRWLSRPIRRGAQVFCASRGGKCVLFALNNPLTRASCRTAWFVLANPVSRYLYGAFVFSTAFAMASEAGSPITRVPVQVVGRVSTRVLSSVSSWWNSFFSHLIGTAGGDQSGGADGDGGKSSPGQLQPMFYDIQQLQSSNFSSDVEYGRELFKQYHLDIPSSYVNSLLTTDTHYRLLKDERQKLDDEFKLKQAAGPVTDQQRQTYQQQRAGLDSAMDQDIDRTAALMAMQAFIEKVSPEVNPPADMRAKYPALNTYDVLMKSMHADAFASQEVFRRRDLILKQLGQQAEAPAKQAAKS